MNKTKIYKRLSGGAKYPVGDTIWYYVLGFIAFSFVGVIVFAATDFKAWGIPIAIAAGALSAAIFARFIAIKRLRDIKRRMDARRKKFENISDEEWQRLEDERVSAEFFFDTFYFLEDYLYIPKPRLLIRYTDIARIKSVIHSTNGMRDAVYMVITDDDGIAYRFYIKRWKQYLEFQHMFNDMFNEKRNAKAGDSYDR